MKQHTESAAGQASSKGVRPHHKPGLRGQLEAVGLGVTYHRASGDSLYFFDRHGCEVEVLDLVGGYGSLLFGHSHPQIVAVVQSFLQCTRPIHAQGSILGAAERLATELSRRAEGDFCAVFANSGAEAVEAALKHAMLETGGHAFLALEQGFHGKTLAALQLTDSCSPAALSGLTTHRVRRNDVDHLLSVFAETRDIAGMFVEPVQGEGGVHPLDPAFAQLASELCRKRGVPLVADECQSGLGRTGTFLAGAGLGIQPDYIILSKALGGFTGYTTPITGVAVEVAFAIPCYLALVIGFIRYWEIVLDNRL